MSKRPDVFGFGQVCRVFTAVKFELMCLMCLLWICDGALNFEATLCIVPGLGNCCEHWTLGFLWRLHVGFGKI